MKVAVSIPDDVFQKADGLARHQGVSRSAIFSAALVHYLEQCGADAITAAYDAVLDEIGQDDTACLNAAAADVLKHTEW